MKLVGEQGTAGQPIIAANAWLYYEAATYSTEAHPVMYLNESLTEDYGSLAMLKDDAHGKIMSLSDYTSTHRYVWYLKSADASVEIEPPVVTWKKSKKSERMTICVVPRGSERCCTIRRRTSAELF